MEVDLRVDRVVARVLLAAEDARVAGTLEIVGQLDAEQVEEGRHHVDVRDEPVEAATLRAGARHAHGEQHPRARVEQRALLERVGQPVVRGEHDDGVLVAAALAQRVEHETVVGVGHGDALLEARVVGARHLVVGDVHRRLGVVGDAGVGIGPRPVRRMLAKRDEERALAVIGPEPLRQALGVPAVPHHKVLLGVPRGVGREVLLVAEGLRGELVVGVVADLVLDAAEHAVEALVREQAREVARPVDVKPALREAEHAVLMRVGAREQPRTTRGARGRHAERLLEEHRILTELLDAGSLDGVAVGGDHASRVMGVQVENVHAGSFGRAGRDGARWASMLGASEHIPPKSGTYSAQW